MEPAGTKVCATCGAAVDTTDWFPVAARPDDAGMVRTYAFCGDRCRESWIRLADGS